VISIEHVTYIVLSVIVDFCVTFVVVFTNVIALQVYVKEVDKRNNRKAKDRDALIGQTKRKKTVSQVRITDLKTNRNYILFFTNPKSLCL
jgi:hypothetical protein